MVQVPVELWGEVWGGVQTVFLAHAARIHPTALVV
jgi:hypothetical protein